MQISIMQIYIMQIWNGAMWKKCIDNASLYAQSMMR